MIYTSKLLRHLLARLSQKSLPFIALVLPFGATAQFITEPEQHPCGTSVIYGFSETVVEFEPKTGAFVNYVDYVHAHDGTFEPCTIEVVFHVYHLNGPENISDAQILEALAQANMQLAGGEGGFNTNVVLSLACNGINRLETDLTDMVDYTNASLDEAMKDLSRWDPSRYLNVWILRDINGGAAGYAYYPGAPAALDGVVIENRFLGTTGTAAGNVVNTLAHEVGHYLYLYHTFDPAFSGNACLSHCDPAGDCLIQGDRICDTEHCWGAFISASCNPPYPNGCPATCPLPTPRPVENYMSYVHGCQDRFTEGQAVRMHWALEQYRPDICVNPEPCCGCDVRTFECPGMTATVDCDGNYEITITGDEVSIVKIFHGGDETELCNDYTGTPCTGPYTGTLPPGENYFFEAQYFEGRHCVTESFDVIDGDLVDVDCPCKEDDLFFDECKGMEATIDCHGNYEIVITSADVAIVKIFRGGDEMELCNDYTGTPCTGPYTGTLTPGDTYFIEVQYFSEKHCLTPRFEIKEQDKDQDVKPRSVVSTNPLVQPSERLAVYPNPFNGAFTLAYKAEKSERVTLELTSSFGQILISKTARFAPGTNTIEIETGDQIAAGIYFVVVTSENGEKTSQRIVYLGE